MSRRRITQVGAEYQARLLLRHATYIFREFGAIDFRGAGGLNRLSLRRAAVILLRMAECGLLERVKAPRGRAAR